MNKWVRKKKRLFPTEDYRSIKQSAMHDSRLVVGSERTKCYTITDLRQLIIQFVSIFNWISTAIHDSENRNW